MKSIVLYITSLVFACGALSGEPSPSQGGILLRNINIIDVHSGATNVGDVHIVGDTIHQISYTDSSAENEPPKPEVIYDLSGKYLVPGLIDNHVHITHGSYDQAKRDLKAALGQGITGVRDMGGDGRMLAQLQRDSLLGDIPASDVYFSTLIAGEKFFQNDPRPGQVALGAKAGQVAWQWAVAAQTDFPNIIAQAKGIGATAIKIYTDVNPQLMHVVSTEARRQGLKVWAHGSLAPSRPSDVIAAQVEVISHAGELFQYELVDQIKDRYAFESVDEAKAYRAQTMKLPFDKSNPKIHTLLAQMKDQNTILDATLWVYSHGDKARLTVAKKATRMAYEYGIKIAAGSDELISENGRDIHLHDELVLLVESGLSPIDALRAATIINAEGLGAESKIGSIDEGKVANLVVLNEDPLSDISNTRSVYKVIKRGVLH